MRLNVVVSVVSHGHEELVRKLLDTYIDYVEWRLDSNIKLQFLITHNLSSTTSFNKEFGAFVLDTYNTNPVSFGENHNNAFRLSQHDVFIVCNPDVTFTSRSNLENMVNMAVQMSIIMSPFIDEGNGAFNPARRKPSITTLVRRFVSNFILQENSSVENVQTPEWLPGVFMVFKSEVFKQLNGFDISIFMYYEDADICRRARLAGYEIGVDSDCVIQHAVGRGSKRNARLFLSHVVNAIRVNFMRKWP